MVAVKVLHKSWYYPRFSRVGRSVCSGLDSPLTMNRRPRQWSRQSARRGFGILEGHGSRRLRLIAKPLMPTPPEQALMPEDSG